MKRLDRYIPLEPNRRSHQVQTFEADLRSRIVGQEAAIAAVSELYQVFRAGLSPAGKPVASLLFLGPTGSGKTRTVEAVAEVLHGDPRAFLKIDCAEYQHGHEIAKLIGSPPGYLGHRETHPLLTQESLDHWHTDSLKLSLLLFDEIEKASDILWKLLLGVLDKATLTLGDNRRVDFSDCLIFMTSNLGAAEMANLIGGTIGFGPPAAESCADLEDRVEQVAREAARRSFPPEFLNRIDKMVVFRSLRAEQLEHVLEVELCLLQDRILKSAGERPFALSVSPAVKNFLLSHGTDPRYGARHLKRSIEVNLVAPLASLVASAQVYRADAIHVELDGDGKMVFLKTAEGVPLPPVNHCAARQQRAATAPASSHAVAARLRST